jgi:pimeloyl-ACP methyl ester carboxylesterase
MKCFNLGSDPSAPPVIAAHGITSNSHAWLAVARALAGDATLVAADLRGRGDSAEIEGPFGADAHVSDLVAILDRLELERAVLAGHSLGGFIVARLAAHHPDRIAGVVLVDGGLRVPATESIDAQQMADLVLGPALARLRLIFASAEEYRQWWREHPAIDGSDISAEDLIGFADHDLVGSEPELRSSVREEAVRSDAQDLPNTGTEAEGLSIPATLLCAPRGMTNDPNPIQPWPVVEAWAAGDPGRRRARLVEDTNHYTLLMGSRGAEAVADAMRAALGAVASG